MTAWDESAVVRAAIMREGLDLGALEGLEIGALAHPIVRRSDGRVMYVDQADAASLRRTYADSPMIDAGQIVDVDAVWGSRTLTGCLSGRSVDYVMASHVAEHVPDLITWLDEVRAVLRPGGELRLALPDRRYSHDALRAPTRLGDLVAAWIMKARRPQVRDVLDFRLHTASGVDGCGIYRGDADLGLIAPDHAFEVAVQSAKAAFEHPETYFDVHCLVASAPEFASLMQQLAQHGLLQMACQSMTDAEPPLLEYYVFMTPCGDQAEVERSWREVPSLPHRTYDRETLAGAERSRLEADLAAARAQLEIVYRSHSWRLTAPLRRLCEAGRRLRPGVNRSASRCA